MAENTIKKIAILKSFKAGASNKEAYDDAGVPEKTFYNWHSKPEFFKQCEEAKESGNKTRVSRVVDVLYKKAMKGDLGAICFYLKNRASRDWKEKQEVGLDDDTINKIIRLPAKKSIGAEVENADSSKK